MNIEFARKFAEEWVEGWNLHDLDRVLSHYTDDFEMSSPVMIKMGLSETGTLKGKAAIGAYWRVALDRVPDLHFTLRGVYFGVNSVVIHYDGPRGIGTEVFEFNAEGKVFRSFANYDT